MCILYMSVGGSFSLPLLQTVVHPLISNRNIAYTYNIYTVLSTLKESKQRIEN